MCSLAGEIQGIGMNEEGAGVSKLQSIDKSSFSPRLEKEFVYGMNDCFLLFVCFDFMILSQIRYSLVVILGLNSVSEVQYKDMMIDR